MLKPSSISIDDPPRLHNGDRLQADEFLRRWEAMPELRHAELIGGRVFLMPSPVSPQHGEPHARLAKWFGYYQVFTPGLELLLDTTTRFDDANVAQPDAQLNLPVHAGGRTIRSNPSHVAGVPDLVAEIAYSSENKDLRENFELYQSAGVREYLVWRTCQDAIDWWVNTDAGFRLIQPDEAGVMRSEKFPGLCLDRDLLIQGDDAGLLRLVERTCGQDPRHPAFCQRLSPAT